MSTPLTDELERQMFNDPACRTYFTAYMKMMSHARSLEEKLQARPRHPDGPADKWGHAEDCPMVQVRQGGCNCTGGRYVRSGRGPRQIGAYDG